MPNLTKRPDFNRIAFYPCCARDIREPKVLLQGIVDEIVFCDIKYGRPDHEMAEETLPACRFLKMDARLAINFLPYINVLFYRRDGTSEGGSGLFVLGADFFPRLLSKMTSPECLIITDGSNSRGSRFRKMQRNSGLIEGGKHISMAKLQRFEKSGLLEFRVVPVGAE